MSQLHEQWHECQLYTCFLGDRTSLFSFSSSGSFQGQRMYFGFQVNFLYSAYQSQKLEWIDGASIWPTAQVWFLLIGSNTEEYEKEDFRFSSEKILGDKSEKAFIIPDLYQLY